MRIAVLSGKGGTGKTTVAASLAACVSDSQYADCDVEEPNGFIFLKPELTQAIDVRVRVPEVDKQLCTGCGACARICQFNALAVVKGKVLVFPELCHHCGACLLVCQPGALHEVERSIGLVEANGQGTFYQGRLNIGEPTGIPIIETIKQRLDPCRPAILDCSPGAACAVVKSLEDCDAAVLVTEPTPFGLHDLAIAAELTRRMGIPAGVVINKADPDEQTARRFCRSIHLPVLMEIPFSRSIAEQYARGRLPVQTDPAWRDLFLRLYDAVCQLPLASGSQTARTEVTP